MMIRELTPYEREKWLPDGHWFELDEDDFLTYGDELGEAFMVALQATHMGDYGLSDEFVAHAVVQSLDMYYDQIMLYTGNYGGYHTPEELGLPPKDVFLQQASDMGIAQISYFGSPNRTDKERKLWDWAMEWRDNEARSSSR
jgi:hypothetical protein